MLNKFSNPLLLFLAPLELIYFENIRFAKIKREGVKCKCTSIFANVFELTIKRVIKQFETLTTTSNAQTLPLGRIEDFFASVFQGRCR